ncbi:MAG: hypothetical protein CMI53_04855 [Parcubacteria group bacterium]|nr:hypothetical protein [Parcubacteria group bacterium]
MVQILISYWYLFLLAIILILGFLWPGWLTRLATKNNIVLYRAISKKGGWKILWIIPFLGIPLILRSILKSVHRKERKKERWTDADGGLTEEGWGNSSKKS